MMLGRLLVEGKYSVIVAGDKVMTLERSLTERKCSIIATGVMTIMLE
jgi:hypothetical protein